MTARLVTVSARQFRILSPFHCIVKLCVSVPVSVISAAVAALVCPGPWYRLSVCSPFFTFVRDNTEKRGLATIEFTSAQLWLTDWLADWNCCCGSPFYRRRRCRRLFRLLTTWATTLVILICSRQKLLLLRLLYCLTVKSAFFLAEQKREKKKRMRRWRRGKRGRSRSRSW